MVPDDTDRVAIVTGGAVGIGRAVAAALVDQGVRVALVDVASEALTLAQADLENRAPDHTWAHRLDLSDHHAYERLVIDTVERWGRLDYLVNNAADTGSRLAVADITYEEWMRVLDTNLTAPMLLSRDAAGVMAEAGGGAIVNVSSIQARLPLDRHVCYVASKGGLEALTRALAVELGPAGIRVNTVSPGVVATEGLLEAFPDSGRETSSDQATLSGRPGHPADVAATVLFLLSDAAAHISGATLSVDGGRTLSRRPDPFAHEIADRLTPTGGH